MSRVFVVISLLTVIVSGIFENNSLLSYSGLIIATLMAIFATTKAQNKFDRNAAAFMLLFCVIKALVKVLIQNTGGA